VANGPSVRAKRSDGRRSERRILDAGVRVASVAGLHGLTIGALASEVGMSKSGLYAHFGSKEGLQLAVLRHARSIFTDEVLRPGLAQPAGRARLEGVCDAFLSYVERSVFPGGCFFAAAASEVGGRPGLLRDRVARHQERWLALLDRLVREAVAAGELDAGIDPAQAAFEINAALVAANTALLLRDDDRAAGRAREAIARTLTNSDRRPTF
jgi:AcrR family transcriptional regulator